MVAAFFNAQRGQVLGGLPANGTGFGAIGDEM